MCVVRDDTQTKENETMTTQTSNQTKSGEFGVNIWWHLPEFVIPAEAAHKALEDAGFEQEQDMPVPSRRAIVSRAAYSFQDRRHNTGRRVTEKTRDGAQYVTYGILGQTRVDAEEVAFNQDTKITLDKESGRVEAEGSLAEDFHKALEVYDGAVTDEDVRYFLRRVIKMCFGIAKRPTGGIYFVPDRFVTMVNDAQRFLDSLGIGGKLYVERVVNGTQERAIVWDAVENDIGNQIDSTLLAVERIGKRANAVTSHQAKLTELNGLMDIYRNLLGEEARHEELAERLEDAANTVAAKMSALQAEADGARSMAPPVAVAGDGYKRSKIKVDVMADVESALVSKGAAMHYAEIAKVLKGNGVELRATATKTEAQWLLIQINKAVRNNSGQVQSVGRGIYAVA